ncbi:5-formyltetrahydrofolate cyclo-ligase [Bacillus sp. NPDC077027]|uniref:5-formyltetrahydrofolate cyclo-ligase n=1 Tax=Bacillus sp. NPDC077027 TaxID=3390548 RepID=UPI003D04F604
MKKELRTQTLAALEQMKAAEVSKNAESVYEHLFQMPEWREAKTIGLTISRGLEVPTAPIIEEAWKEGKMVCVPTCFPKDKQMIFYQYTAQTRMTSGYFGLKEPDPQSSTPVKKDKMDLMVVPGVCFDQKGYRIGYGGGYYDRYLHHYKGVKLALAFSIQVLEEVPKETHDIPVSLIVTEKGTKSCVAKQPK